MENLKATNFNNQLIAVAFFRCFKLKKKKRHFIGGICWSSLKTFEYMDLTLIAASRSKSLYFG